jgi:hypothetical protein
VEGNLERALSEDPRPGAERKLTGKEEALLVATTCANPPAGRARWTLELLADAMVKLTEHESLSHETVRRRLAENGLKPWRKDKSILQPPAQTKQDVASEILLTPRTGAEHEYKPGNDVGVRSKMRGDLPLSGGSQFFSLRAQKLTVPARSIRCTTQLPLG